MFCKKCGRQVKDSVTYCPYCGQDLSVRATASIPVAQDVSYSDEHVSGKPVSQPIETYSNMRTGVPESAKQPSGNNCLAGEQQYTPIEEQVSSRSKITALLLCLFLGELGIHRFYVGKTVSGIVYLLTCGAFGIGVIVDFFMILLDSFNDVDGLPLKK